MRDNDLFNLASLVQRLSAEDYDARRRSPGEALQNLHDAVDGGDDSVAVALGLDVACGCQLGTQHVDHALELLVGGNHETDDARLRAEKGKLKGPTTELHSPYETLQSFDRFSQLPLLNLVQLATSHVILNGDFANVLNLFKQ